jgi:hypothetical protein
MNPAEAMESQELLGGELATRDPRGATMPRMDTVASPEEWEHHKSNQRAHNVEELDANHPWQLIGIGDRRV